MLVIAVLVGLTTVGLGAAGAAPVSVPAAPIFSVTPSGELADGQTVSVGGHGFDPRSTLQFYGCTFGDCQVLAFSADVDAVGDFHRTITVSRGLNVGATQFDCAVVTCTLAVSAVTTDPASTNEVIASIELLFGSRPTLGIAPSVGLLDGQRITVTGEHFVPGQTVHAWECQDAYLLCTRPLGGSGVVAADGRVSVTVRVVRWINDYMDGFGAVPMDCAVEICHLALTLDGGEYEDGYLRLAVTTLDFAPRAAIAAGAARVVEGDVGVRSVTVPLVVSPAIRRARPVRYRTFAWSAHSDDFEAAESQVWIPAGATKGFITLNVRGDLRAEDDESLLVEFRGTRRDRHATAISVVTILDDDA